MHSSPYSASAIATFLLPLIISIAIIPAAYFYYGAGSLCLPMVPSVTKWVFNNNSNHTKITGTTTTSSISSSSNNDSSVGSPGSSLLDDYTCLENPPNMRPMFLSYEPIMVYLENFVTEFERDYLVDLASPLYEPSEVRAYDPTSGAKQATINPSHRLSETAWLPSPDPVVACIRRRAAAFQGHAPNATIDSLAALRYRGPERHDNTDMNTNGGAGGGGRFGLHHDWDSARVKEYDRRTSFFVTLLSSSSSSSAAAAAAEEGQGQERVTGGSTWFPYVKFAWTNSKVYGRPWCKWVDCEFQGGQPGLENWGESEEDAAEKSKGGVAVKPIAGNAVFWVNFKEDGTGIHETLHAGEPVVTGTKIGMNIWTWSMIGAEGGGIPEE